jgi:hypothetical protein
MDGGSTPPNVSDTRMSFPAVQDQYFEERNGVLAVASLVNHIRCIWRETPNADVGIDGQIEFVDSAGTATGLIVAAQVKSGPSYFKEQRDEAFVFRPSAKHMTYWAAFPIPVMVVLYDHRTSAAYWADARQQLRSPYSANAKLILVPIRQLLSMERRNQFFETSGPIDGQILSVGEVIRKMASERLEEPGFSLSYLDVFWLGLTDMSRKLFFSMGLCTEIAAGRNAGRGDFLAVGYVAHLFIDGYIDFLVTQNLIYFDYCDYLIDKNEQETQPEFLAPLTPRGRQVRDALDEYCNETDFKRPFVIDIPEDFRQKLPDNLSSIEIMIDRIKCT